MYRVAVEINEMYLANLLFTVNTCTEYWTYVVLLLRY